MATYVYGVSRASARRPGGRGIGGAPLRRVTAGATAALVSELPDGELRLGRDELMIHSRVLERASARDTVLPMRFGVTMSGAEEVRSRLLTPHGAELRRQLDALDGKVEVGVRAIYDEQRLMREVVAANPRVARARERLRALPPRAGHYGRIELGRLIADAVAELRERDAATLLQALAPAATAVELAQPAHERIVLAAAFLVAREQLDAFDAALERVAAEQDGRMRFRYLGPRPPYSFVELAGGA